jgi:hypothetical protein
MPVQNIAYHSAVVECPGLASHFTQRPCANKFVQCELFGCSAFLFSMLPLLRLFMYSLGPLLPILIQMYPDTNTRLIDQLGLLNS